MDPITIGTIALAAMIGAVAGGVPVGIAMIGVASLGMYLSAGWLFMLTTLETLPFAVSADYAFVVLPMFMLMGALTSQTGITGELYTAAHRWVSGMRGGLYYATILASGAFGAINGSTVVSAVLFTKIALPEMIKHGYNKGISAAAICCAGTFAALIPPSIALILYGLLTNESVGALLIAGVVPGLLTIAIYMLGVGVMLRFKPSWAPSLDVKFSFKEKMTSLKPLWAIVILIVLVMGGIYTGAIFPSAAGAVGSAGAIVIAIMRRRMPADKFWAALRESLSITAALFLIIIGGLLFSRLLLVSGFVSTITDVMIAMELTPALFVAMVIVLYLVLGMFVDSISLIVMTIPVLHPIAVAFGLDPIWFGVVIVKLIELAVITPPVGLNLYAVIGASEGKVSSAELFRGVAPFILFELVTLAIIIAVPQLTLWMPGQMMQ